MDTYSSREHIIWQEPPYFVMRVTPTASPTINTEHVKKMEHGAERTVFVKVSLKPIFHCDAKPLALGLGVGLEPQHNDFALPIPTCWYLKTLKFALPQTRVSGI